MASTESGNQHYNLKWTNHTNNILQMFMEQLHKECLVDVTLSCEGQFIKAHKMVLSACSPYFHELFSLHSVDHPVIIMNGVKYNTLQQMIDFMYEGETKVESDQLDTLLITAENFQIKGLCKLRREQQTKLDSQEEKPSSPTNNESLNIIDVDSAQPRSRKRRKQSHSPILNQSVEGTPSDTLFAGLQNQNSEANKTSEVQIEDKAPEKQTAKIPRPPNAFMIFANEWRKRLAIEHQGESNKDISVRLGTMWKTLPVATKDYYYSAAKKADEEHKVKYPGYYYSPKEARMRKEMRGNNSKTSSVLINSTGVVKDIDTTSLVTLVMPDMTDDNSNEMTTPNELKEEPEAEELFVSGSESGESERNSPIP